MENNFTEGNLLYDRVIYNILLQFFFIQEGDP